VPLDEVVSSIGVVDRLTTVVVCGIEVVRLA